MDGLDLFNTFGFTLESREKKSKTVIRSNEATDWYYDINEPDWIDGQTGSKLAKYKPLPDLEALLQSRVNTDFE